MSRLSGVPLALPLYLLHAWLLTVPLEAQQAPVTRAVTLEVSGWRLRGDLLLPGRGGPYPSVLLLNKAGGARSAYEALAQELAAGGIASLRLDLRGHGESVNRGRFLPGDSTRSVSLDGTEEDILAGLRYLRTTPGLDSARVAVVGASYSAELAAEVGRRAGWAKAYVALSPGSLSLQTIDGMDPSGVPWLVMQSRRERSPAVRGVLDSTMRRSRSATVLMVADSGHATDLVEKAPEARALIAAWLGRHLAGGAESASDGQAASTAAPCTGPAYRALDFWLGAWTVRAPDGRFLGTDSVTKILRDCVVYERWHGASGGVGQSWNTYDRRAGVWRATWVNDAGVVILASGQGGEGRVEMRVTETSSPPAPEPHLERWIWLRYPSRDSMRVVFELSTDQGATWKNLYDGRYYRRSP
jgi:dienelactone hydrolase